MYKTQTTGGPKWRSYSYLIYRVKCTVVLANIKSTSPISRVGFLRFLISFDVFVENFFFDFAGFKSRVSSAKINA